MAYLIECDRCGGTQTIKGTMASTPREWLQFHDMWLGDGSVDAMRKPIEGGVFCQRCVNALREWRRPTPRCEPKSAA